VGWYFCLVVVETSAVGTMSNVCGTGGWLVLEAGREGFCVCVAAEATCENEYSEIVRELFVASVDNCVIVLCYDCD
jgi:hypothetical protein